MGKGTLSQPGSLYPIEYSLPACRKRVARLKLDKSMSRPPTRNGGMPRNLISAAPMTGQIIRVPEVASLTTEAVEQSPEHSPVLAGAADNLAGSSFMQHSKHMKTPISALDLGKQAPHSPRERLAGFVIARRAVDKCRASLAGTLGEYHFDCPLDNLLFTFKGITGEQFKTAVQVAADDEAIGVWLQAHGAARTPAEIKTWSDAMEASSLVKDSEKRAYFIQSCSELGLNPQMNTTFDWLEADDRESFRRKTR